MQKIVQRVSIYDLRQLYVRVNVYERTHAKGNNAREKTAYTRVNGCVLCEWRREKRLERDARVRARAFFSPSSPSSLFFSSSEYSSPLFHRSSSSFSFSFFLFFGVYTRAILCALYFSSYTITRGCTRHFLLSLLLNSVTTPHVYFRRRLSSPHRHSSTYCFSLCESKVSCIYIYILLYIRILYIIYIYMCVYNCSAVSPIYHTASSLDLPL